MAEFVPEDNLSLISKGLYRLVCEILGPECIVQARRQKYDIGDLLTNGITSFPYQVITSGSRSEGFDFKSSDFDFMYADEKSFVCTTSIDLYVQNLQTPSLFYMEDDECSPGFTLLRSMTCDRNNEMVYKALVRRGGNMYFSSKTIRETFMSSSMREVHGPCQSGSYIGMEADYAYTLKCKVWPKQAISFVTRSQNKGWPSHEELKDICNDGCLFVPISSKQQTCSDMMDLEWRISFSLAEKKLICSMNHCQFLCYGLTKLFLNEVLKTCFHTNDLLCSYFMKTAVFWELSERSHDWSKSTFLFKFWNVIRRLIKWISYGYCPNFFIPEYNMFHGKIYGQNQIMLLSILRELYTDGVRCLLRCPSLYEALTIIIAEPFIAQIYSCNEEDYISVSYTELERLCVVFEFDSYVPTANLRMIQSILHITLNINTDTEVMTSIVRLRVNYILQKYAEFMLHKFNDCSNNKKRYPTNKAAKAIILRAKTNFCMNYLNYAKCTYVQGNYHRTIDILHFITQKLQSQSYMCVWKLDRNFIEATRQQGMPYDTLIKSFVLRNMEIEIDSQINELHLECLVQEHTGSPGLYIPPLVFIYLLLILSYTRIGYNHRRYDILEKLQTLLNHDYAYHIRKHFKAISWEILGICQQICGDHQSAFQSYTNALNDEFNYFKHASITRINSLYN